MRKRKAIIEFLEDYTPKALDVNTTIKEYGEPPKRKGRSDSGKPRAKYNPSLPLKYRQYLGRANKKSIVFSLTVEQFETILNQSCVYCGSSSRITIDRKDSSEGYHINNCQSCCFQCNIMKYTFSEEAFLKQVDRIHRLRISNNLR